MGKVAYREKSSSDWKDYYSGKDVSFMTRYNKVVLNSFQRPIFRSISAAVSRMLKKKKTVSLLSAGAGIDFIAYSLKKRFKDEVSVTIFDISEDCINMNRYLFGSKEFKFVVGDIFTQEFKEKFDIVYNTGLIEHFTDSEKRRILGRVYLALNKGGQYITLNPSAKGKIYRKGMMKAKIKKMWPYGREVPIVSLKNFSTKRFSLSDERDVASGAQLSFIVYYNKFAYFLIVPFIIFTDLLRINLDAVLGPIIGYYGLLSTFTKRI
jgi:ubiquinone/menaquinone biosynthesis C-methylase UbiE